MKKIILSISICFLFYINFLSAQLEWGTHFMNNSLSQSNLTNPALFSDFNASITMPSVYAGFLNSQFSLKEVISIDENVLRLDMEDLLNRVDSKGLSFQTNLSLETIGMNFQSEDFLFNLHHGIRVFNQTTISRNMLEMLWKGNEQFIDETIDIGIQENFLAYQEVALALGFKIKKQLTFGIRAKYLKGLGTIQTPRSVAKVYTSPEFYQLTGETDYLVQTGGYPSENLEDINPLDFENYEKSLLSGGNKGVAFDIGMSYRINKKLTFETSLNNIGFINWDQNVYNYESKGNYKFEGLDLQPLLDEEEISVDEIIDTITQIFQFENTETTFKTTVPANGYLSIRYELAKRLYLSSFLFMEKNNSNSNYAGGLNLKKDFGTMWTLGVQYVYHNQSTHNVGLMTSLRLGPIQLYATTDNVAPILDPLDTRKFNFRTGLNLVFGNKYKKRKKRQQGLLLANAEQDSLNSVAIVTDSLTQATSPRASIEADKNLPIVTSELPKEPKKENTPSEILVNEEIKTKQKREAEEVLLAKKAEEEKVQQLKEAAEQKRLEEEKALLAKKAEEEKVQKLKEVSEQKRLEEEKALLAKKAEEEKIQQLKATSEQKRLEEEKALLTKKSEEEKIQQLKAASERKRLEEEKALLAKKAEEEKIQQLKAASEQKRLKAEKALLAKKAEEERIQKLVEAEVQQRLEAEKASVAKKAEEERLRKLKAAEEQQRIQAEQNRRAAELAKQKSTANFGRFNIIKKTSLRQEATSSSKVVKRLEAGTRVIVLEKTNKYWWKVDYKGKIGFVKAALLD